MSTESLNQTENKLEFKSEIEKDLFEIIEDRDYRLMQQDLIIMVLALEGLKPVSEISISMDGIEGIENKINHLREVLTREGLFLHETEAETDDWGRVYHIHMSRDFEILREHMEYMDLHEDSSSDEELIEFYKKIGSDLGFPETAAEGFANNRRLEMEDLPQEVAKSDTGVFFREMSLFVLSKDFWRDELEFVAEKWIPVFKEKYPVVYKSIMIHGYINDIPEENIQNAYEWDEDKKKRCVTKLLMIPIEDLSQERVLHEIQSFQ